MNAAKVLRDAADYIAEHGLRQDGEYGVKGGPCCAIGAIGMASSGDPKLLVQAGQQAWGAMELALPVSTSLASWNDRPETTADDVIALLNSVADDLENESAS